MEKLRATLKVEEVSGKRGPFNVGKLLTSIGVFKVTDKRLDQFTPGSYAGEFLIEHLRTRQVDWRDGTFSYIQARIADEGFLIDEEAQLHPEGDATPQAEPDPLDSEEQAEASASSEPSPKPDMARKPASSESASDDEAVFGVELYPLFAARQSPIKLDTTVDRNLFRLQHARLKAAGYRFVSQGQHWILEGQS